MSDEDDLSTVFEQVAERTYGEDTPGEDMATIQRWHFIKRIGIPEEDFSNLLDEGQTWVDETEETFDDPDKIIAGFALVTLAQASEQTEVSDPGPDPMFQ